MAVGRAAPVRNQSRQDSDDSEYEIEEAFERAGNTTETIKGRRRKTLMVDILIVSSLIVVIGIFIFGAAGIPFVQTFYDGHFEVFNTAFLLSMLVFFFGGLLLLMSMMRHLSSKWFRSGANHH